MCSFDLFVRLALCSSKIIKVPLSDDKSPLTQQFCSLIVNEAWPTLLCSNNNNNELYLHGHKRELQQVAVSRQHS